MLIMIVTILLLMIWNMEYENNSNHSNNIPAEIDEVIREVTPVAWLDNPLKYIYVKENVYNCKDLIDC